MSNYEENSKIEGEKISNSFQTAENEIPSLRVFLKDELNGHDLPLQEPEISLSERQQMLLGYYISELRGMKAIE